MSKKLAIHRGPKAIEIEFVEAMRAEDITDAGGGVMQERGKAFANCLGVKYLISINTCYAAFYIL